MLTIYLILPVAIGPGIYSASNRNEYHRQKYKCFLAVERGWCVRLTTLLPSVSRLSSQCRILNISQPCKRTSQETHIWFSTASYGDSFMLMVFIPHGRHMYGSPRPFTGIALPFYMWRIMFVPYRRFTSGPPRPVTGIALCR
jgi:hypothetical protein